MYVAPAFYKTAVLSEIPPAAGVKFSSQRVPTTAVIRIVTTNSLEKILRSAHGRLDFEHDDRLYGSGQNHSGMLEDVFNEIGEKAWLRDGTFQVISP